MHISEGIIAKAKKVVIYGPEGIGKSTLSAQFPQPLFIDTEGSTAHMDVRRFDEPESWQMILDEVQYVIDHPECCKTLVIDTADWAEKRCSEHVCAMNKMPSIESFGYGKGYTYLKEEFGRLLNKLTLVTSKGINVVLTAHAMMRKFEQPDEMGAYDRWELKLSKQTAPLVKEWCDMLLFCNYKTMVVNVDGKGSQKGKNKAQGSRRMMYTQHHACWDAKNRYNLEEEIPMSYAYIRDAIEGDNKRIADAAELNRRLEEVKREAEAMAAKDASETPAAVPDITKVMVPEEYPAEKSTVDKGNPEVEAKPPKETQGKEVLKKPDTEPPKLFSDPMRIPPALRQLMEANNVSEWNIQSAVASKGYYPSDTLIQDYDPDFIDGCLISAWPQVYQIVQSLRDKEEIPFK